MINSILNSKLKNYLSLLFDLNRWFVFFSIFLISGFITFYIFQVISVNNLLKELQDLNKNKLYIENYNKVLETELHKLQSPERIRDIAEKKLGLIPVGESPEWVK